MTVDVEDGVAKGAFVARKDGVELGRITYSRAGTARIIADHTEVAPEGKGLGVGQAMFERLVSWSREQGLKVVALCPFVASRFQKYPDTRDVLDA